MAALILTARNSAFPSLSAGDERMTVREKLYSSASGQKPGGVTPAAVPAGKAEKGTVQSCLADPFEPLPITSLIEIACPECFESSGYIWNHGRDHDGAEYSVRTDEPCPVCKGDGYVWTEAEPITLEDLDEPLPITSAPGWDGRKVEQG